MKILAIIAVIFSFLLGSKLYIYWRLSRSSWVFSRYKKSLAATLLLVFICEVGFWILAKDLRFYDVGYNVLGLCVAITYCLFVACLCVDILWLCGKALSKMLKKVDSRNTQNLHEQADSTFLSSRDFRKEIAAIHSTNLESAFSKVDSRDSKGFGDSRDSRHSKDSSGTHAIAQSLESHAPMSLSRRKSLKILHDLGVFGLFFLFFFTSRNNALHTPPVRNVAIPLPKLKQQKRIAMISDVHIGHILKAEFLERIVARINTLNADIVVIVGDLIDDDIRKISKEFGALQAIASKEGVFYVNGNHEYYHGIAPIMEFMRKSGVRVLDNESIELSGFNLAGVNDLAGLRFKEYEPNLERAKQDLNPSKPSILLAHQPKFARLYDVSEFDLVLSGHTHAGQVFPMSIFVWLDQHYIHGLYNHTKDTKLYVSSGAGFWGPSFRFLAPSEIVCIDLLPSESAQNTQIS